MTPREVVEALYQADLKQIEEDRRLALAEARRLRSVRLEDILDEESLSHDA
ncbi:hypothetical protein [Paracoccus sp. ME4]|uniref:hypothetical protein n=1 Tax=Paracoccus sp. ME4 TaxID=3138066 RepID=UPI00398A5662